MDEIIKTIIGQSPTIAALIFFIIILIKDRKETQQLNIEKDNLQNTLEKEFRQYLVKQNAEHHVLMSEYHELIKANQGIIKTNVEINKELTAIFKEKKH